MRHAPGAAHHFARVTFFSDNRADLQPMHQPTPTLQCRDDAIAPDAVGQYILQRANTGMAQLVQQDAARLVRQRLGGLMTPAGRIVLDDHVVPMLKLSGRAQELALQARPADGRGTVTPRLAESDGQFGVVLADDGVGLRAGFDPGTSRGLGMRIVQALLLQLDARLETLRPARGAGFLIMLEHRSSVGVLADPAVAN